MIDWPCFGHAICNVDDGELLRELCTQTQEFKSEINDDTAKIQKELLI